MFINSLNVLHYCNYHCKNYLGEIMAIKSDRCRKCGRNISEDPECTHFCKECEEFSIGEVVIPYPEAGITQYPDKIPLFGVKSKISKIIDKHTYMLESSEKFAFTSKELSRPPEVVVRRKNASEKIDIINKVHFSMRSNSMSEACKINEVTLQSYKS